MKTLIVANWKLNPSTKEDAVELFNKIKSGIEQNSAHKNAEVVICPPFVYLPVLKGLTLGAQNVFYKEEGAYTGEVSPIQLRDLGVKYVIIGHSEARRYLNETDEVINKKIKACLTVGLKVILCIGENTGEDKQQVLERQLNEGLREILNHKSEILNLIIAYEPVWAIGTGQNCSVEETLKSVLFIKKIIYDLYGKKTADGLIILYGGSVNSENSAEYLKNGQINGLLVGGDSLNADDFIKVVKSADLT